MRLILALVFCISCGVLGGAMPSNLILTDQQLEWFGEHVYLNLELRNTQITTRRYVPGSLDYVNGGYLNITVLGNLTIDENSTISAEGAGYSPRRGDNGAGRPGFPNSGGKGGCSVLDSGGGGGHFGAGGAGTKDCGEGNFAPCIFPNMREQNCGGRPIYGGDGSQSNAGTCDFAAENYPGDPISGNARCCWESSCNTNFVANPTLYLNWTGLPFIGGGPAKHTIFDPNGMGAAGGDSGVRDGGSFSAGEPVTGGFGGGRLVLEVSGDCRIQGSINSDGTRGCAKGNDSGGGGAGGSLVLRCDRLFLGPDENDLSNLPNYPTKISARGGAGGDSQPSSPDFAKWCPSSGGFQQAGVCDDCGGGGSGGIVYIEANTINIPEVLVTFGLVETAISAKGGLGGFCPLCILEAQGDPGIIVLHGPIADPVDRATVLNNNPILFAAEDCNGIDDTWDGLIDEDQAPLTCDGVLTSLPSCASGALLTCPSRAGQACGTNEDCASLNCTSNICAGNRATESCEWNAQCEDNDCTGNVCIGAPTRGTDEFCADDSECLANNCTNARCQGDRTTPAGSPCIGHSDCQTNNCTFGVCVGKGALVGGDPCVDGTECQSTDCGTTDPQCSADCCLGLGIVEPGSGCAVNSDCTTNLCTSGVCEAILMLGDACDSSNMCISGSCGNDVNCVANCCLGDGTALTAAECVVATECLSGNCDLSIGECSGDGSGGTTDACINDSDCSSGICVSSICEGDGTGIGGEACLRDSDCATNICDGGICQVQTAGGPCTEDIDCTSLACVFNFCEDGNKTGTVGEACLFDEQCTGYCNASACALREVGQVCTGDEECSSGACEIDSCVATDGQPCVDTTDCQGNMMCIQNICGTGDPVGTTGATTGTTPLSSSAHALAVDLIMVAVAGFLF